MKYSFFETTKTTVIKITQSHGNVTDVVRAIPEINGRGQITKLTLLNRESPSFAHMTTSTIFVHMMNLIKIAQGATFPHITKVTTHFFFLSLFLCTQNLPTVLALRL